MNRDHSIQRLREQKSPWDIAIIGGGAAGMGIAVDAASRGYSVCLFEQSDFGKSTSSKSTKLVHGGVRYLKQGNISLVKDALRERERLLQNAPHLVHDLPFIVPCYSRWDIAFYGTGLKAYDLLAGKKHFGKSRILSRSEVLQVIPTINQTNLRGGVLYHDGQFDDTRLLIQLAQTATIFGAALANYIKVENITHDSTGKVTGLWARDLETGEELTISARCIINATGVFSDQMRTIDQSASKSMVAISQGTHIILPKRFLFGDHAIMIPKTPDGRVLFAIPWQGQVLVGTTDRAIESPSLDTVPTDQEIDFILDTAGQYLYQKPTRDDILSTFSGLRPLVSKPNKRSTAALSRDHMIDVSASGMITIVGGKWTTYRKMAEDCVDRAIKVASLTPAPCRTMNLVIYGRDDHRFQVLLDEYWMGEYLHREYNYTFANVVHAVRHEMARTLEDVLSRRLRLLHLDVRAAIQASGKICEVMRQELRQDTTWWEKQMKSLHALADNYLPTRK